MKPFLLCFVMMLVIIQADFLPERLRIVDSNEQLKNYLVRGNLPIKNKEFQLEELKSGVQKVTGLKRYKLIVVSLMNSLTAKQTKNRYIQQKFFDKNKKIAQYRNRIVIGAVSDLHSLPNWVARSYNWLSYDFNDLNDVIEQLRNEIHSQKTNTIVYIHCSAGVDRTGLVSGAYRMKYLDLPLQKVMKENEDVLKGSGRKCLYPFQENGLQWYCYSLGRSQEECRVSCEEPKKKDD